MKIMGVDPSISCTGIGLPDQTTIAVRPRTKGDDRLEEIADHLHVTAVGCGAELVVMEDAPTTLRGAAGRVLLHLQGSLRLELRRMKIPYMILSPSTLKKFATGSGNADKTAMAMAAYKRLGREYGTDDECDADWLRIAGRFAYGLVECGSGYGAAGGRVLSLPQTHLTALRRNSKGGEIVWPVVGGRQPWPSVALRA